MVTYMKTFQTKNSRRPLHAVTGEDIRKQEP